MAELVDALASGASDLMVVEVQVLFWAPNKEKKATLCVAFFLYLVPSGRLFTQPAAAEETGR